MRSFSILMARNCSVEICPAEAKLYSVTRERMSGVTADTLVRAA